MTHAANAGLTTGKNGIDLIKNWEKCYLKAYDDGWGNWTIGYGSIHGVHEGMVITKAQALAMLAEELATDEAAVKKVLTVPVTQNQFGALVSFVYNAGIGTLKKSQLLKLINRGNFDAAALQFKRYNHATNKKTGETTEVLGLTRRRAAEMKLFLTPDEEKVAKPKPVVIKDQPDDMEEVESNVIPDSTPPKTEGALQTVIAKSDTFKGIAAALAGIFATIGSILEPLKDNPVAMASLFGSILAIGSIFYFKLRDTGEGV